VGSEKSNERLSGARAEAVVALLEGERAAFVSAAGEYPAASSDGKVLSFSAAARGYDCAPANPEAPTKAEIEAFQKGYNAEFDAHIGEDGVVGDETRGAYFDVFKAELRRLAGGEEALLELRGALRFADPSNNVLLCGERFPIESPDQDELASEANRRVELLFFDEDDVPDLAAEDAPEHVYRDGDVLLVRVDPETLEELDEGSEVCDDEFGLEDAPPPEDGTGELLGELATAMDKREDERDPEDQHAFLEPFHDVFPEFLHQAEPEPLEPTDSV
jgi:hypothetical protein